MLSLLKKFFGVGNKPTVEEAPYKVEATAPKVEPLPAGIEAVIIAPAAVVPESIKDEVKAVVTAPKKVVPKQAAPKKQQFEKKAEASKAPPKPRAPRKPVAK